MKNIVTGRKDVKNLFNHKGSNLKTATFGMGWYWGAEARFGHLPGIVRTRVGFSGGNSPYPTPRNKKDHTETVQLDFNPEVISYHTLLNHFFLNHNPNRKKYRDREYISIILYHSEEQRQIAEKIKKEQESFKKTDIQTEITLFENFTMAENRQQKWHIKRVAKAMEELKKIYQTEEEFIHATLPARLNSHAKGYGNLEETKKEIQTWKIEETKMKSLLTVLDKITI